MPILNKAGVLVVCAALLTLLFAVAPAEATPRTFRCDRVWDQPSSRNKPEQCLANASHLQATVQDSDHGPWFFFILLPVLILAATLVCCPAVTIGRTCCGFCGSTHQRPGHFCYGGLEWDKKTEAEREAAYTNREVRVTKGCSVFLLTVGVVSLILILNGTTNGTESYDTAFTEVKDILTWIDEQGLGIRTLVTINETGALIPPIQEGLFTNISSKIDDFGSDIDDIKDRADQVVQNITIVALVLGVFPILLLVLTVLAAACDWRSGILCCNLVCNCLFVVPYAGMCVVFLLLAFVAKDVCGERELFLADNDAKGLLSLSLVPICNRDLPFKPVREDVDRAVRQQAKLACEGWLTICDASPTFNSAQPSKLFQCRQLAAGGAAQCTSVERVSSARQNIVTKTGAPIECRRDLNDSSTTFSPCSIIQCASSCVAETPRRAAATANTSLHYLRNVELALELYVDPLLDCPNLYTQAFRPLKSCDDLTRGFELVGGGLFGFTVAFALGLIVIMRGQKRFFKQRTANDDSGSEHDDIDEETRRQGRELAASGLQSREPISGSPKAKKKK